MSELKATPGPWCYRPHEYDDWGVVKAGYFTICQARDPLALEDDILNRHRREKTDPWAANARLIAAAPELYEAADLLEKAETAWANCDDCEGVERIPELCGECFPLFDEARLKRRAALAKARGEA